MRVSSILGLNSRGALFTGKYNDKKAKKIANSKIQTNKVLRTAGVPHPLVLKKFKTPVDIFDFDWSSLPDAFALKPSRGLGGDGIIVVKKRISETEWLTSSKQKIAAEDLKLHIFDILEGAFSMGNDPDVAFVQEYVGRHTAFRKLAFRGTPDIRVIVFNKIPVMAMLRLPTKESEGRANLHQGALGLGIDLASGITTKAIQHGKQILFKPGTLRKLHGIKIPHWDLILETSVRAQIASGLKYAGIDVVLHPEKGPQVIELNSQPGLQIQLANMDGLRKRLDRVDDMEVRDSAHGVAIAKALFASKFIMKVKREEGVKVIKAKEIVKIFSFDKKKFIEIEARVDTGAARSSIDRKLAERLGILNEKNHLWNDRYRSATGVQSRSIVGTEYILAGKRIKSSASVADRSKMSSNFLIGRNDMTDFVVNPNIV